MRVGGCPIRAPAGVLRTERQWHSAGKSSRTHSGTDVQSGAPAGQICGVETQQPRIMGPAAAGAGAVAAVRTTPDARPAATDVGLPGAVPSGCSADDFVS